MSKLTITKLYNKPAAGKPSLSVEHEFELFKKLNATRLQYIYVAGFNFINELEAYCKNHPLDGNLHYAYYQNYTYGVFGLYNGEWEEVTCELTRKAALEQLKTYRESEPEHQFKLRKYKDKKQ